MAETKFPKESVELLLGYKPLFEPAIVNAAMKKAPVAFDVYSVQEISDFLTSLDTTGFNLVFDYQTWLKEKEQSEGKAVLKDAGFLAKSDLDTLRKLMTAHIRTERFVRGHIASLIAKGYMGEFMNRLEIIYQKM